MFEQNEKIQVFTKNVSTSLSLPVKLLVKIDSVRGDVSRSKFIAKILMKELGVTIS
jgi:metal-responsive CopG/Arc/MetJ family transcriptional regulator